MITTVFHPLLETSGMSTSDDEIPGKPLFTIITTFSLSSIFLALSTSDDDTDSIPIVVYIRYSF